MPDLTLVTQNTVDSCLFCNWHLHANFGSVNNISDELKLCKPNIFGWNKHGWFLLVINHFMLNLEVQKNESFTEVLETGNICPKQILLILICFVTNQYIVHLEVQTILMMHPNIGNQKLFCSKKWFGLAQKKLFEGWNTETALSKIVVLRWHDMTVYLKQFEKFEPTSQKNFFLFLWLNYNFSFQCITKLNLTIARFSVKGPVKFIHEFHTSLLWWKILLLWYHYYSKCFVSENY